MALDSIRQLFTGLFAGHATSGSLVPPAITAAEWTQMFKKNITFLKPIADAAANASYEWPIFSNIYSSTFTVTAVKIIPFAALTADSTNYKTVAVQRRTAAGSATVIASANTKLSGAGGTGDWVALTPITLTNSSTAADLVVPAGADLFLSLAHTASGVAVPVISVTIEGYYT